MRSRIQARIGLIPIICLFSSCPARAADEDVVALDLNRVRSQRTWRRTGDIAAVQVIVAVVTGGSVPPGLYSPDPGSRRASSPREVRGPDADGGTRSSPAPMTSYKETANAPIVPAPRHAPPDPRACTRAGRRPAAGLRHVRRRRRRRPRRGDCRTRGRGGGLPRPVEHHQDRRPHPGGRPRPLLVPDLARGCPRVRSPQLARSHDGVRAVRGDGARHERQRRPARAVRRTRGQTAGRPRREERKGNRPRAIGRRRARRVVRRVAPPGRDRQARVRGEEDPRGSEGEARGEGRGRRGGALLGRLGTEVPPARPREEGRKGPEEDGTAGAGSGELPPRRRRLARLERLGHEADRGGHELGSRRGAGGALSRGPQSLFLRPEDRSGRRRSRAVPRRTDAPPHGGVGRGADDFRRNPRRTGGSHLARRRASRAREDDDPRG